MKGDGDPNPAEVHRELPQFAPEAACATNGAAAAPVAVPAFKTSLATLLAAHILRDGELVILILRPSLWFVLLSSLRFIGVALLLMIAAKVFDPHLPGPNRDYVEIGTVCIAGRLMWASLHWMGRLYVLTDMRLLSLVGVLHVEVFDCPLRKVARTRLLRNLPERVLGVGTIEVAPQDESLPFGVWQTIAHPKEVHEQVLATLRRAKQGVMGAGVKKPALKRECLAQRGAGWCYRPWLGTWRRFQVHVPGGRQ